MTELAKFAWTAIFIIFFVGLKIFVILGLAFALLVILHFINPKWFEPN